MAHAQPPVVVELFSSQNCPACPPADKYMEHLVKQDNVIALSCHVNYFGMGTGGLSRNFCTGKQQKYKTLIGRKSMFTPQMMINGHMSEIGYDTNAVAAAIIKGRSEKIATIDIRHKTSGVFSYHLPSKELQGSTANLWLASYDRPHTLRNIKGENLTYYNVANQIMRLGQWNGTPTTQVIAPILKQANAGFVIIAQDNFTGRVLAAGEYKIYQ